MHRREQELTELSTFLQEPVAAGHIGLQVRGPGLQEIPVLEVNIVDHDIKHDIFQASRAIDQHDHKPEVHIVPAGVVHELLQNGDLKVRTWHP